jgi:D-sedoheptulose 7-phosphate isomerase
VIAERADPPVQQMLSRHPELTAAAEELLKACEAIQGTLAAGGCLYLCGNGGSMADAVHISAELLKSYTLPRPLESEFRARLTSAVPDGEMLGQYLERGLRAIVLGLNHSLSSAIENDIAVQGIRYAQELSVLAHPGDVLLGISTSGNSPSVCYAAQVAHTLEVTTISLTGQDGGRLAQLSDIAIRAPATQTDRVQELHVLLYHCLCETLEVAFFGL